LLVHYCVTAAFVFSCDSNALKFTPVGGHVQVKAYFIAGTASAAGSSCSNSSDYRVLPSPIMSGENGKIRIEIMDTGPGIYEVICNFSAVLFLVTSFINILMLIICF
jgi:hypothetical protein